MRLFLKLLRIGFIGFLGVSVVTGILGFGVYIFLAPGLPRVASLKDVHLQTPLRVYAQDKELIAIYGQKRREPLPLDQIPPLMRNAFLAAEDDRYFEHPGVDYQGILRAIYHLIKTGEKDQGGSTITMQLTRNFFLTNDRTYERKLKEIFLALKVERVLSKRKILDLYLNKIYLGNRAYGVGAAAEVYYGLQPNALSIDQIAMIAGLPKAPSAFNPIVNPERARARRNYVLKRMHQLSFINDAVYRNAARAPVTAKLHQPVVALQADYVGEMVRAQMVERFGTKAYTRGYNVYTTLDPGLQRAANRALRKDLLAYDRRHGYRGPEDRTRADTNLSPAALNKALAAFDPIKGLLPGVVTAVDGKQMKVYLKGGQRIKIDWDGLSWARPYIDENRRGPSPKRAGDIAEVGDVVRVTRNADNNWRLTQLPDVSGALVSLDPDAGGIQALVGGFDFYQSQFNRATQAHRQPGSNFKPFIYSAALAKGFTPASIINDAPVVFENTSLGESWRPENYSGKFFGPTRMRTALKKSRNMVSIRLLQAIGKDFGIRHVLKFGFKPDQLPHDLTLALGSAAVSPLQLARGFAVFANGGYLIDPHYIERIETSDAGTVFEANPPVACQQDCKTRPPAGAEDSTNSATDSSNKTPGRSIQYAPRVISRANAYQVVSMMQSVIQSGTGRKARVLKRDDLSGKTGTTNDQRDAWFSGYNRDIVTTTWVGFDQDRPLGRHEVGGVAALPMWIDFMRVALQGKPSHSLAKPDGMVTLRIDPDSGLLAAKASKDAITETFRAAYAPTRKAIERQTYTGSSKNSSVDMPEQMF